MIVRMTLGDNEYTNILEAFSKNLTERLLSFPLSLKYEIFINGLQDKKKRNKPITEQEEEYLFGYYQENCDYQDKMNAILNPILCMYPNEAQIEKVKESVKKHFDCFVERLHVPETIQRSLRNRFTVDILAVYQDEWENGSFVYYFIRNNKYLIN